MNERELRKKLKVLNNRHLSEAEKIQVVTELAKRYHLNAEQIANRLHRTQTWVRLYLPSEFVGPIAVSKKIVREVKRN